MSSSAAGRRGSATATAAWTVALSGDGLAAKVVVDVVVDIASPVLCQATRLVPLHSDFDSLKSGWAPVLICVKRDHDWSAMSG
jgi:hypothetical protein